MKIQKCIQYFYYFLQQLHVVAVNLNSISISAEIVFFFVDQLGATLSPCGCRSGFFIKHLVYFFQTLIQNCVIKKKNNKKDI